LLAEGAGRLDGEDRFLDLPRDGRLVAEQPGLDELLRDRRAALADAAGREVDLERANDAAEVDARVGPEAVILDRDRRVLHEQGDLGQGHELAALVLERVQKVLAGAVVDVGRERDRDGREVMRGGKVSGEVAEEGGRRGAGEDAEGDEDRREDTGRRAQLGPGARAARHAATAIRHPVGAIGTKARPVPIPERHWRLTMHGACRGCPRSALASQAAKR